MLLKISLCVAEDEKAAAMILSPQLTALIDPSRTFRIDFDARTFRGLPRTDLTAPQTLHDQRVTTSALAPRADFPERDARAFRSSLRLTTSCRRGDASSWIADYLGKSCNRQQ